MPPTSKSLPEDLPDPADELPDPSADDISADIDDLRADIDAMDTTGMDRKRQLDDLNKLHVHNNRYTVTGAHTGYGADFVDKSNYEWFRENFDWLGFSGGEVYIDVDDIEEGGQTFEEWLAAIEEASWDNFIEAVEGLDNYPVLDEQRMSEMEMEALDEWIADDGHGELKKALAKKEMFANSFAQFAIARMSLQKVYELSRESEWQYEGDSVWINMERVAEEIDDEDAIFTDHNEHDIRPRLKRQFMRYKRYAWNAILKEPFREVLMRHIQDDTDALAALKRLNDEQLFAFLLYLTPDDAWGTGEPAWYEDTIRGARIHHDIWNIALDEGGKWEEALDVLGMIAAEKLYSFFRAQSANDPRQMKLPGFESAAQQAATVLEAGEEEADLTGDDAEFDLRGFIDSAILPMRFRGPGFVVYEPQDRDAVLGALGRGFERKEFLSSDDAFERYRIYSTPFLVSFPNSEAMLISEGQDYDLVVYGATQGVNTDDTLMEAYPEVIQGFLKYYATLVEEEPERALNMLLKYGGPEAVAPFEDKIDDSVLPSYTMRAGIAYAVRGDYKKAARLLKNRDAVLVKKGAWVFFGDWEDTAPLFADTRNYNWEKNAEKLFAGEAYDWFDYVYQMDLDHRDAYRLMLPKHWNLIREALPGREVTDDAGETVILTTDIVNGWRDADIQNALDSYDENPDLEEIVDKLRDCLRELERRAAEDATYEGFRECAKDAAGATEWRYFTVKGKKMKGKPRTDRLAFFVPYTEIALRLDRYYDDTGENFDGSFKDLIIHTAEKAVPSEEYSGRVDKETGPDIFDEMLSDLEAKSPPVDPRQQELPLESAGQRVATLLEDTYDRGCLMIHVPKEQADFIQDWGRIQIPDDVLYTDEKGEYGREADTHITVKWGILMKKPDEVLTNVVGSTKVFPVRLGRVSLFDTNPDYDVVKIEVESPWLRALNARIRGTVPNEETHPSYNPHCTIAYVKKGSCDQLVGKPVFGVDGSPNSTFYVQELMYKGPGEDGDKSREHKLFLKRVNEGEEELDIDDLRADIDALSEFDLANVTYEEGNEGEGYFDADGTMLELAVGNGKYFVGGLTYSPARNTADMQNWYRQGQLVFGAFLQKNGGKPFSMFTVTDTPSHRGAGRPRDLELMFIAKKALPGWRVEADAYKDGLVHWYPPIVDEAKQPDPFEKLPFPADPSRVRKRKPRRRGSRSVCS